MKIYRNESSLNPKIILDIIKIGTMIPLTIPVIGRTRKNPLILCFFLERAILIPPRKNNRTCATVSPNIKLKISSRQIVARL